ncbi:MAG TPA: GerMN domain-containing protein [Acidimicrobiia bacterium]|nr:GerMN domain-containing protein [Acidimicrobiia bacterium]
MGAVVPRTLLAVVGTALLALSACGVPGQDEATFVGPDEVPFDLLEPSTTTTVPPTTTTVERPRPVEVRLCYWRGERLRAVTRDLPPARVQPERLVTLPPSAAQTEDGLESRVLEEGFVLDVAISGGVARVDLAAPFAGLASDEQLAALAQTVCTLTSQPGVGQVSFTLEGAPVEVPRGDGSVTANPVSRDDYANLIGNGEAARGGDQ